MQNKIITLPVIFVLLFSLQGFSQSDEKSAHPLLDKYYPHPQSPDTNKTISSQIKPVTQSNQPTTGKTISPLTVAPAVTTSTTEAPPSVDTTTRSLSTIPAVTTTPSLGGNTNIVNKPATVSASVPAPKKGQTQAEPGPPTMDTRLGSSTRQYDTWEKNSNGAGSVTTSPK